ncbi:MAG TPA: hypothetical protein VM490_19425 [Armatimonadaceae bacterium]|nr:hypothetical protein [Armatimonadaceae bacterium]
MNTTQLLLLGLSFLALMALAPLVARLLCRAFGLRRPLLPERPAAGYAAVGLTPLLVAVVFYGALMGSGASLGATHAPVFLMVALACGLPGLLEDVVNRPRSWPSVLAWMAAPAAGIGASYLLHRGAPALPAYDAPVDAGLIALGSLAVWTLNGRPGRAFFSFALLFLLPALVATGLGLRYARMTAPTALPDDLLWNTPPAVLLGPVVLAAALEWWPEARGRSQLGSIGARMLGGLGGLAAALALPLWAKLALLGVLLALTLLGRERIEAAAQKNSWLRALDRAVGVR